MFLNVLYITLNDEEEVDDYTFLVILHIHNFYQSLQGALGDCPESYESAPISSLFIMRGCA